MIKSTTFVVVDTETTGSTPALDRVIEIGAVKVIDGKIVDKFHRLINPERYIPHNVFQIHNISDEMVENAPIFEQIADEFLDFLGMNSVFVAHNVDFDKEFLNYELSRLKKPRLQNQSLCTIKLAKKIYPDLRKYNLSSLASNLGIPLKNAHRALDDSETTANILLNMFIELANSGKHDLSDINLKPIQSDNRLELF